MIMKSFVWRLKAMLAQESCRLSLYTVATGSSLKQLMRVKLPARLKQSEHTLMSPLRMITAVSFGRGALLA